MCALAAVGVAITASHNPVKVSLASHVIRTTICFVNDFFVHATLRTMASRLLTPWGRCWRRSGRGTLHAWPMQSMYGSWWGSIDVMVWCVSCRTSELVGAVGDIVASTGCDITVTAHVVLARDTR